MNEYDLNPLERLSRDVVKASVTLGIQEIRYLVDSYYSLQEYRKASANQELALSKSGEPPMVIMWLRGQTEMIENQIRRVLDKWTDLNPTSAWAKSITGIGPVISAGLAAHIDIKQAPTAGHIWSFAGLNPTQEWLGSEKASKIVGELLRDDDDILTVIDRASSQLGVNRDRLLKLASQDKDGEPIKPTRKSLTAALAKRPWNASLKTLCWKIGESFVKVSGLQSDVYGKLYLERKDYEQRRNDEGVLAEQAAAKLEKFKIGKTTDAYKSYSVGRLPPAHIHARAKRYAVKMFLSHYQHVAWVLNTGTLPPKPWVNEHGGHAHYMAPPNFDTDAMIVKMKD